MSRRRLTPVVMSLLFVPGLAWADDWSDALYTELERGDADAAAKLYRKVAKAGGPHAAEARLRRIDLLAKQGKVTPLVGAITAFLQAHPKHRRAAAMRKAKADPKDYAKRVMARHGPQDRNAQVRKRLKGQNVTLNFPDTPVTEVVGFLRDITGLNVVTLADVPQGAKVTLRLKNQSLEDAMLEIVKSAKLAYDVIGGTVVIGKNPAALRRASFTKQQVAQNPDAYLKLKTRTVTLNFPKVELETAASFIHDITRMSVDVDSKLSGRPVSLRLKNVRLDEALTLICAGAGAKLELTAKGLKLVPRGKTK